MLFKQVHPRWASLVVSIWGAAVTGSAYAFGVYSLAIRGNFDLLSSEIDTIGTWQLLGGFFNFVIGGFMDKYGPAMSCRWGGVIQSIFLFLEWAVARKVIAIDSWPVGPTFVLTFFACISQLGNAGVACAVYTTPVKNFPGNSGIVIAYITTYHVHYIWVGASGGILTQLMISFLHVPSSSPNAIDFLLLTAVVSFFFSVLPSPWLTDTTRPLPKSEVENNQRLSNTSETKNEDSHHDNSKYTCNECQEKGILYENRRFIFLYMNIFAMIAVISVAAFIQPQSSKSVRLYFGFTIFFLLVLPIAVVFPFSFWNPKEETRLRYRAEFTEDNNPNPNPNLSTDCPISISDSNSTVCLSEPLIEVCKNNIDSEMNGINYKDTMSKQESIFEPQTTQGNINESYMVTQNPIKSKSFKGMLLDIKAWCILLATVSLCGGGLLVTTNAGQITHSLGLAKYNTTVVTLFSSLQSFGRLFCGFVSDFAVSKSKSIPRPLFLSFACFIMMIACTILASATDVFELLISIILSGLAFGHTFPMIVLLVHEIFGPLHFGKIYQFFDGYTGAISGLVFAKFIFQHFYKEHSADGGRTCSKGNICFEGTFHVTSIINLLGCLASLYVAWSSRQLYNDIWHWRRDNQK